MGSQRFEPRVPLDLTCGLIRSSRGFLFFVVSVFSLFIMEAKERNGDDNVERSEGDDGDGEEPEGAWPPTPGAAPDEARRLDRNGEDIGGGFFGLVKYHGFSIFHHINYDF